MEIVAIPSMGNGGLKELMNPRFGRCEQFTIVSIEDGTISEVRTVPNPAASAMGGAGTQASQIVGSHSANAVISGFLGPNAFNALKALNITMYKAPNKDVSIKEVINMYINGELEELTSSNAGPHAGMGGGMGAGRGMGRG
jgi:predicted Fe-Mo cluster-binding NifX family protein